jgi:hypothetical protein
VASHASLSAIGSQKNPRWGYEEKTRFSSSTPEISRSK